MVVILYILLVDIIPEERPNSTFHRTCVPVFKTEGLSTNGLKRAGTNINLKPDNGIMKHKSNLDHIKNKQNLHI